MAFITWVVLTPFRTMVPGRILVLAMAVLTIPAAWMDFSGRRLWKAGLVAPDLSTRYGESLGWGLLGLALGSGLSSYVVTVLTYGTFLLAGTVLPLGPTLVAGALLGTARTFVVGPASFLPTVSCRLAFRSGSGPRVASAFSGCFALFGGAVIIARAIGG